MLNRLRDRHPLLYCLLSIVLFMLVMMAGSRIVALLIVTLTPEPLFRIIAQEDFLMQAVNDLFGFLTAWVLLRKTGGLQVFTRRGTGFWDGLLVGMFPFVLLSLILALNVGIVGPPEGAVLKPAWQIVVFLLTMFLIGLAEESIFRGIIARTLLEHFGVSRGGIWKAVVVSGLLFGAGHAVNLLESEPLGVLIQCCITAVLGMLYAAIYFRTGNLWVVVFLHTYQDAAALINTGLYQGMQTVGETVSSYDPSMLVSILLYLLPIFFLLRKRRLPEVAIFSGLEPAPVPVPDQTEQPET